jgi:hypothetical protein
MKNSNKVSQVVKIIINQKKKKKTKRKTKKAKELGTLQNILNFQRLQNSYSTNPPNNGLNAGDVLNIVSSKMKTYTTGMIDGRPIKIQVGMEGKELEKSLLSAFADKDKDGKTTRKELDELKEYARHLKEAYDELSFRFESGESPVKPPTLPPVQPPTEQPPIELPPKRQQRKLNYKDITNYAINNRTKGNVDKAKEIISKQGYDFMTDEEIRNLWVELTGNQPHHRSGVTQWVGDLIRPVFQKGVTTSRGSGLGSGFDDSFAGGGLLPPPPPLSPIEGDSQESTDLGNLGGGGII